MRQDRLIGTQSCDLKQNMLIFYFYFLLIPGHVRFGTLALANVSKRSEVTWTKFLILLLIQLERSSLQQAQMVQLEFIT